jgi:hypothetical protein
LDLCDLRTGLAGSGSKPDLSIDPSEALIEDAAEQRLL